MYKSVLKLNCKNIQIKMAEKRLNPYDLCSKAEISYAGYRRIMNCGNCKLSTLGKLAEALDCNVTEIIFEKECEQ